MEEGQSTYRVVVPEANAHLPAQQFSQLIGAPLRCVRSFVLDKDKPAKGLAAVLTCAPPRHRTRLVGAKQQTRLPNDIKLLNANGMSALERHVSPKRRGVLWRQSIVWQLDYRCAGTALCDAPAVRSYGCNCSLRVRYFATVEQIDAKAVTIEVTGSSPVAPSLSLHSRCTAWTSSHLSDQRAALAPAHHAALMVERTALDELQSEMISQQRREAEIAERNTSAMVVAGASLSTSPAATLVNTGALVEPSAPPSTHTMSMEVMDLHEQVLDQERVVRLAAMASSTQHSRAVRDQILQLMACGCAPSEIQSRWNIEASPMPTLMYIHGVVNEERRRGRLALPPYEAMHVMCKDMADDRKVMLYLVADPNADSTDSVDALHLVMCCTPSMIDRLRGANGLGLDTKWRTCEGGGCVIGTGAFHQHRAKVAEGRRGEFEAGYVHSQYSPIAIALSNLDCYFSVKVQLDAIRGLLPCDDPSCSHPLRRIDLPRGGFVMQRACASFPPRAVRVCSHFRFVRINASPVILSSCIVLVSQVWWKGFSDGQSFKGLLGMIDKCGFERRALVKCGFIVILCDFHAFAAMLEQYVFSTAQTLMYFARDFTEIAVFCGM